MTKKRASDSRIRTFSHACHGLFWALLILSGGHTSLARAQDLRPQDFLPLAVGNSWEYGHAVSDRQLQGVPPFVRLVEIRITHTEEIGGHTYFVFSDMPYDDPPVPYFSLPGKKVRFEGRRLLFREQDGDVALYQFEFGVYGGYTYAIPETHGDTLVSAGGGWGGGGRYRTMIHFTFRGHDGDEWRYAEFVDGFGLFISRVEGDFDFDTSGRSNFLDFHSATINGVRLDPWDVYTPTAVKPRPWGFLKQRFMLLRKGD